MLHQSPYHILSSHLWQILLYKYWNEIKNANLASNNALKPLISQSCKHVKWPLCVYVHVNSRQSASLTYTFKLTVKITNAEKVHLTETTTDEYASIETKWQEVTCTNAFSLLTVHPTFFTLIFISLQFCNLLQTLAHKVNTHGSDQCCCIQVMDFVVLEQVGKRWKLLVANTET